MKPNAAVLIFLQKWNIKIWDAGPMEEQQQKFCIRKCQGRQQYMSIQAIMWQTCGTYGGDTREQHEENHFYHHNSEVSQM